MVCSGRRRAAAKGLLLLKALAVGALIHRWVGLMRADLNGVQTAVLAFLAVVGAVGYGAANGGWACRRSRCWYDRS